MSVMKLQGFADAMDLGWGGKIPPDIEHAGNLTAARPFVKVRTEQGADQYRPSKQGAVQRDYGRGLLLWLLSRVYKPVRALEIGFGRGYGTFCLAKAAEEFYGTVMSIDRLDFDAEFQGCTFPEGDKQLVTTRRKVISDLLGETRMEDVRLITGTSAEVLPEEPEDSFDLVFVDGAHDMMGVQYDIQQAMRLCPNGVLLFHDYRCPATTGVTQAIDTRMNDLAAGYDLFQVVTDGWIKDGQYHVFNGIDSCILVCVAN